MKIINNIMLFSMISCINSAFAPGITNLEDINIEADIRDLYQKMAVEYYDGGKSSLQSLMPQGNQLAKNFAQFELTIQEMDLLRNEPAKENLACINNLLTNIRTMMQDIKTSGSEIWKKTEGGYVYVCKGHKEERYFWSYKDVVNWLNNKRFCANNNDSIERYNAYEPSEISAAGCTFGFFWTAFHQYGPEFTYWHKDDAYYCNNKVLDDRRSFYSRSTENFLKSLRECKDKVEKLLFGYKLSEQGKDLSQTRVELVKAQEKIDAAEKEAAEQKEALSKMEMEQWKTQIGQLMMKEELEREKIASEEKDVRIEIAQLYQLIKMKIEQLIIEEELEREKIVSEEKDDIADARADAASSKADAAEKNIEKLKENTVPKEQYESEKEIFLAQMIFLTNQVNSLQSSMQSMILLNQQLAIEANMPRTLQITNASATTASVSSYEEPRAAQEAAALNNVNNAISMHERLQNSNASATNARISAYEEPRTAQAAATLNNVNNAISMHERLQNSNASAATTATIEEWLDNSSDFGGSQTNQSAQYVEVEEVIISSNNINIVNAANGAQNANNISNQDQAGSDTAQNGSSSNNAQNGSNNANNSQQTSSAAQNRWLGGWFFKK